jgi:hypothetical protein
MSRDLHRYYGAHELRFIICSCYHRFLCVLEQTRKRYRFVVVGYA